MKDPVRLLLGVGIMDGFFVLSFVMFLRLYLTQLVNERILVRTLGILLT